jgi:copper(I)-binding protein
MRSVYAISTAPRFPSRLLRGLIALAVGVAAAGAHAQDAVAGDIRIEHAYATPTPPGSRIGAAYLTARNQGSRDDRLVAAASPAAGRVELHMGDIGADGVMRMRELDAVPLPANSKTDMKPGGGHHLMLMELAKPLVAGEKFPMTLEFERGGKVEVQVEIHAPKPGSATHKPGHGH